MSNATKKVHGLDIWVSWTNSPGGSVGCRKTRRSSEWQHVDFEELNERIKTDMTAEQLLEQLIKLQASED